jgi:hypothetical protein
MEDKTAPEVHSSGTWPRRAGLVTFCDERSAALTSFESPSATTHPNYPASRRNVKYIMVYLTLAAMLVLVTWPLLLPATITAVHALAQWRPTYRPVRTDSYPRRVAPRRLAVPAA